MVQVRDRQKEREVGTWYRSNCLPCCSFTHVWVSAHVFLLSLLCPSMQANPQEVHQGEVAPDRRPAGGVEPSGLFALVGLSERIWGGRGKCGGVREIIPQMREIGAHRLSYMRSSTLLPSCYSPQSATDIDGREIQLSKYAGKVVIVVNVASACGYTDTNYKGVDVPPSIMLQHHLTG